MGIIELLGLAGSLSLLSGWRFYLTIFATCLAMHFNIVPLPENLQMLDVLANPWVLGISAIGAIAEFFADKIAWLDSIWDGLHTLVRPVGGVVRGAGGDAAGRGPGQRVQHDEELDEPVRDGRAAGLDDVDVLGAYVLVDLDLQVLVAEPDGAPPA